MKADQERVKNLLIDTVTLLCKNSLTYEDELCVEGLLGVKVDQKDVFFVHISETFPSALSVKKAQEAAEAQRQERLREERLREERLREEEGPGTPSSGQSSGHKQTHSPAHRDSPHHRDAQQRVNIKTESVDSGDDCLITDEPQTPLRNPSSIGAHPAQRIAGQRRPVPSPRSPGNHRDAYSDQHHSTFQSNSSYSQEYPEFSNVGKREGDHGGGDDGEPPRKRAAMSEGDEDGEDGEDDSYGGSQWPNLAGVQGIGDFAGQVAQQAFQDSGDSQMSGGGGDMSQPGCSSWPTGLQQQATDTTYDPGLGSGIFSGGTWRREAYIRKRMHVCQICGKEWKSVCDLEKHSRSHTGEKPFACDLCDARYGQRSTLNRHIKQAHGPKWDIGTHPGIKTNYIKLSPNSHTYDAATHAKAIAQMRKQAKTVATDLTKGSTH